MKNQTVTEATMNIQECDNIKWMRQEGVATLGQVVREVCTQ